MKIPPRPKKQTYWVLMRSFDGSLVVVGYDPNDVAKYYWQGDEDNWSVDDDDYAWASLWQSVEWGLLINLGKL